MAGMGCRRFARARFGVGLAASLAAVTASAQPAPPGAAFPPLPPPGPSAAPSGPAVAPSPGTPPAPAAAPAASPSETAVPAPAPPSPAPQPPAPQSPPPNYAAAPPGYAPQPSPVVAPTYSFAEAPRFVLPEDAAVRSSPFIDATISLISLEDRFLDPLVFGIGVGAYLGQRVRLVARLEMPSTDDSSSDYDYNGDYLDGYTSRSPGAVTLVYGGSVGIVAASSAAFVFSPGLTFLRTDVGEYGNMLGVAIPFEWTTSKGLRFGLEVGFGRTFGGTQTLVCTFGTSCEAGNEVERDRDDARAFTLRFEMGFGFNHPKPERVVREIPPGVWDYRANPGALPPPAFQGAPAPPPQPAPLQPAPPSSAPPPAQSPGF